MTTIPHTIAARPEPLRPECLHCGDQHGPWVPEPSGARYRSGAQVLVCQGRCTPADPDRHSIDPADSTFALLVRTHPDAPVSTSDTYPEWSAALADLIATQDRLKAELKARSTR
ncbi:hypothetical protein [Streptomyces sp. NRRL B-24720]|uniref:hypothetical protein n=1 Tax=Streptomyces sp. NRRL B-24720 TaxID=1476876 RepID=UPI0004C50ABD|nr:hypothetical protein [Streptomyces sp. NRRL B-24720]